ncbi:sialate O-acetylesterase [Paenibacillus sp. R14(2021)]|uniref:sialate O-acetylesterase n=1 Tax=Paenibacillus sp. R14(2021) TaxID=2859228 RepID=UPI001C612847|nr:sialate O-acetylesterase [Paenibacillus sp. R14(2021)]
MNQIGAIIQKGPQHWAIIQQENGVGSITLSGIWVIPEEEQASSVQVYTRIVGEEDAREVASWQPAAMLAEQAWKITLNAIPQGGLYRLETCLQLDDNPALEWAVRGDMIHHIGVGDLWVIAGQSNAAGYGKGPFQDAPQPGIHLLRNNGQWDLATHPFNESTASIHFENRERANPGHSPFLAFGKLLQKEVGIPIGLLQTALGGSPLKAWNPDEDGVLHRNMMKTIQSAGGKVRGILWYQGCSDCSPADSASYLKRFGHTVQHWRRELKDASLPVLTVQLNRCTDSASAEADQSWGRVREAQRQAALTIPNVYVIPALDCPLSDGIHNSPAGNMIIGERMGKVALAHIYGCAVLHTEAPCLTSAAFTEKGGIGICLQFANVSGYLLAIGPVSQVFSAQDIHGEIGISSWQITARGEITLNLARAAEGETVVHGAYQMNPSSFLPLDSGTYMPILAFYGQKVT